MILALIEYDKKGVPVVVKTYLETIHEQWIKQCSVADEAIQFQAKYTELERFNTLHTNLLLTNLIKQGVLRKEGVELDPIIRDKIKVEVARNAWHFSRKGIWGTTACGTSGVWKVRRSCGISVGHLMFMSGSMWLTMRRSRPTLVASGSETP